MNRRQLTVNAVAAAVQVIVTGLAYIVLYRFLLDSLGEIEFGVWALVLALSSASNVANLGLAGACVPFVAQKLAEGDEAEAASIVLTASTSVAGFLVVTLIIGYPVIRTILPLLTDNPVAVAEGIKILPYSLASLWCSSVASVFMSSLEGGQRMDLRSYLLVAAIAIYLIAAIFLVPIYGLQGVAYAHITHSASLLLASWLTLRRTIAGLPLVPCRWNSASFKTIFRYGAGMQLISIAQVLTEPAAKALVSAFGGLGSLSLYEFASRMAVQLRTVIASAHRAVVPALAHLRVADQSVAKSIFLRSHRVLQVLIAGTLPLILTMLPQISSVWIGRMEPFFVFSGAILVTTWFLNLLANPAYFGFLGEGHARWPTISHLVLGIGNVAFGLVLGYQFGVEGVVFGFALALVIASLTVSWAYRRQHAVTVAQLFERETLIFCSVSSGAALLVWLTLRMPAFATRDVLALVAGPCIYAALIAIPVWRNATFRSSLEWVRNIGGRDG